MERSAGPDDAANPFDTEALKAFVFKEPMKALGTHWEGIGNAFGGAGCSWQTYHVVLQQNGLQSRKLVLHSQVWHESSQVEDGV